MHNPGFGVGGDGKSRLRRRHGDKGLQISQLLPADPATSSSHQPESAGSLRKHIAASLMQHHRAIARSNRTPQPLSPPSYASSMEVTPYNPAVSPSSSSLDFKGRIRDSHYPLKTSTELLKVLNRLWSLEENHASNMALIKALKTELDHSRAKIKESIRDQKADRHIIDDLMKQMAEDKLVRKSNEHDWRQSVRDELEDERKLRKRSESLHRKLARELSEVKASLKEMERERKSRRLLEGLCGEFAKRIKEYEKEVHELKQKTDKDWSERNDRDRLVLHISESWSDECMQMKLAGVLENNSIVDKLGFEIETFLQAKSIVSPKELPRNRCNSLESVPMNEASAPKLVDEEEYSVTSDPNCFELNKPVNGDSNLHKDKTFDGFMNETVKSNEVKIKRASGEKVRGRISPSSRHVQFEEQMAWAMSCNGNKNSTYKGKTTEERKSEDDCQEAGKNKLNSANQNYIIGNLIRNHTPVSGHGEIRVVENNGTEASCSNYPARKNQASPIRRWITKLTAPNLDVPESSAKQHSATRENTLKARLLEARSSKGQRSRSKNFRGLL